MSEATSAEITTTDFMDVDQVDARPGEDGVGLSAPVSSSSSGVLAEAAKSLEELAAEQRRSGLMKHFNSGTMPYNLYKTLPVQLQRRYVYMWGGRPKTPDERRREEKADAKRGRARKNARMARRRNRKV